MTGAFFKRVVGTILAGVCLGGSPACAQQSGDLKFVAADAIRQSEPAASRALTTLTKLASAGEYKTVGFRSIDEAYGAKLGEPFAVFRVRLDQLRSHDPGADPFRLLHGGRTVIYPVLVKETVLSSVAVEKVKDDWEPTSFGSSVLVTRVSQMRTQRVRAMSASAKPWHFVVEVPAFKLYFLGEQVEKAFFVIPLWSDQELRLEAGAVLPADKAFALLVPAAKAHDGLPR